MYAPRPSLPKASDGVPLLPAAVDISAPIEDIRASFATVLSLEAVSVAAADVQPLASSLRRLGALFDRPRLPSVLPDPESPVRRLVLLREGGLQEEALALLAARNLELRPHNLRLGYDYWPADVVLRVRGRPAAAGKCWGQAGLTPARARRCCHPAARFPPRSKRWATSRT